MDDNRAPIAVIAGASGFIGKAVAEAFAADGYALRFIGRDEGTRWDDAEAVGRAVDGADVVVNLAGRSVNCRYTDAHRAEILDSRVETTRALREAIERAERPPRVWLNASTATIYRHAMDHPQTEADGQIGSGFSVDVATAWERELFAGSLPATRRVALRMAIMIGDGPATRMLLTLARCGLGGTQFDGWCPPHRRYRGIGAHPTGPRTAPWYRTGAGRSSAGSTSTTSWRRSGSSATTKGSQGRSTSPRRIHRTTALSCGHSDTSSGRRSASRPGGGCSSWGCGRCAPNPN